MVQLTKVGKINPQDVEAPIRFYAHTKAVGLVDLERLAYLVSNQSTVREADCVAVLRALQHNIIDELRNGKVVQLGSLGNFQVGVRSLPSDLEEEVSVQNVKSAHMNFRPGKPIRKMLDTLDYQLVTG
ncbi:HU family DNA-binding protein [Mesonia aquimarina]|uniref:HU family DNA-binding protein n=1 Tax=Mesonia aquimarina TaxID=1504967 RepID=UPI000EF59CBA|nr:HU family DNA-binding protein [Mesonia aquimarina]